MSNFVETKIVEIISQNPHWLLFSDGTSDFEMLFKNKWSAFVDKKWKSLIAEIYDIVQNNLELALASHLDYIRTFAEAIVKQRNLMSQLNW